MSPLFQQRGSKWPPSGLKESMHLSECCGLLLENALGIEKKEENHSDFVSPSLPSPSQAKTLVSEGTTLSFPESVQTKPRRILALSHSPVAEKSSYVPDCLKSKDQSSWKSARNPSMFSPKPTYVFPLGQKSALIPRQIGQDAKILISTCQSALSLLTPPSATTVWYQWQTFIERIAFIIFNTNEKPPNRCYL